MGLFDKKDKKRKTGGRDDFDSPVEQIDLSAPEPEPIKVSASQPAVIADEPSGPKSVPEAAPAAAEPQKATEKAPAMASHYDDEDNLDYGIQQAIELMRTLPMDNVELVVQVVKHTLESTKIKIGRIIDDASAKQEDIQGKIRVRKGEIAELEAEIATRRDEIASLEADFAETSTVKDRLELAQRISKQGAGGSASASAKAAPASPMAAAASGSGASSIPRPARITGQHSVPSSAASTETSGPKTTVVIKK